MKDIIANSLRTYFRLRWPRLFDPSVISAILRYGSYQGTDNVLFGMDSNVDSDVSFSICLGNYAHASSTGTLTLASAQTPLVIRTTPSLGTRRFLKVQINGHLYWMPIFRMANEEESVYEPEEIQHLMQTPRPRLHIPRFVRL